MRALAAPDGTSSPVGPGVGPTRGVSVARPEPVRRRGGAVLFCAFIGAIVAMTVVVSIAPVGDAVVGVVHCRDGSLQTRSVTEGSVPRSAGSPLTKGIAQESATCTTDDGVVELTGDMLAITKIGMGMAAGVLLSFAAMAAVRLRNRRSAATA